MKRLLPLVLLTALSFMQTDSAAAKESSMKVTDLRCEYLVNPLGIDTQKPRLSWILESDKRGDKQTAYRILVASSREKLAGDEGDIWDSGKVESDRSIQVVYDGAPLKPRTECYWKVCAWDANGDMTAFSAPAIWTIGLSQSDWQAKWIAMKPDKDYSKQKEREPGPPAPFFRTTFSIDKPVKNAYAYVTARGIFEVYANGGRIGDDVLSPGWTDYEKHINYLTYDMKSVLKRGENVLGAVLGDGWYSGYVGWRNLRGYWGFQTSLLMQLEIEFEDGTRKTVATDDGWKCSVGPIIFSDLMAGEMYDANRELDGWNTASYNDASWDRVMIVEPPAAQIVAAPCEPIRITGHVSPESISEPMKGVYVFNLGQNIAGWARLKVRGPKGTVITMRFGERLNPSGSVYTTNLRSAKVTDTYILKGEGEEIFEPRFTFHGFQYVELIGYPGTPSKDAITGCAINSDTPPVGSFECSNAMVNKLVSNFTWGQRGNFISIPTDCPQRDERLGWMGDAQIFVRTATFNMDVAAFFTNWMDVVVDSQSDEGAFADFSPRLSHDERAFEAAPGWGDAGIVIPWTMYTVYDDTRVIERHWDAMEKWMDFLYTFNPDYLRRNRLNNNYGDWLSIKADTPKDLLATAYWAYDAKLMADMARAVGKNSDAAKYDKLFENVRSAFCKEFVDDSGKVYLVHGDKLKEKGFDASGTQRSEGQGETQTDYVLALYFDLLPDNLKTAAATRLVETIRNRDWHLSTGFIGVRHLNPVLSMTGHNDIAYRLLLNDTFPSWGYSIKHGATTIWERWDGWTEDKGFQDPGMNSFNHYSLGSVGEWLYRFAAGIDTAPDSPGFKKMVIHPMPDKQLSYVKASYKTMHGTVGSSWRLDGDRLSLDITIPANTKATVYVPSKEGSDVMESGKNARNADGLTFAGYKNGCAVFEAGSGSYRFTSTMGK